MIDRCGIRTVRGNVCTQAVLGALPCCRNHVGHWCVDDSRRTMRVFKWYANRVGPAWPRCGQVCGKPEVREWPEVQVFVGNFDLVPMAGGCRVRTRQRRVAIRLRLEAAAVVADMLTSVGDDAGERIMLAIGVARKEWPERNVFRGGCSVFGCSRRVTEPRAPHCPTHRRLHREDDS